MEIIFSTWVGNILERNSVRELSIIKGSLGQNQLLFDKSMKGGAKKLKLGTAYRYKVLSQISVPCLKVLQITIRFSPFQILIIKLKIH